MRLLQELGGFMWIILIYLTSVKVVSFEINSQVEASFVISFFFIHYDLWYKIQVENVKGCIEM